MFLDRTSFFFNRLFLSETHMNYILIHHYNIDPDIFTKRIHSWAKRKETIERARTQRREFSTFGKKQYFNSQLVSYETDKKLSELKVERSQDKDRLYLMDILPHVSDALEDLKDRVDNNQVSIKDALKGKAYNFYEDWIYTI